MMDEGVAPGMSEQNDLLVPNQDTDSLNHSLHLGLNDPVTIPLGDIVLCRSVIEAEAIAQSKPFEAHWVHLAIHGMLHLFGFSHHDEESADCMESLEIRLLQELGFNNPYIVT